MTTDFSSRSESLIPASEAFFKSARELALGYVQRLTALGSSVRGEDFLDYEKGAYGVCFSEQPIGSTSDRVMVVDMDDTIGDYSGAKDDFHALIAEALCVPKEDWGEWIEIFRKVNDEARPLPADGTHPKKYSPLLEMAVISRLLVEEDLTALKSQLHSNEAVREYIRELVRDDERLRTLFFVGEGDKKQAYYFQEVFGNSGWLNWEVKPKFVEGVIWDAFKTTLLKPDLMAEQWKKFSDDPEAELVLMTFGEGSFQLEKVCALLGELQSAGLRLPDAVVWVNQARKVNLMKKIFSRAKKVDYYDNSKRQVDEVNALKDAEFSVEAHQVMTEADLVEDDTIQA